MADQLETCLQEFLRFLIVNPNLLSAYKTFVVGTIASLDAQIAATTLVIVQIETLLNVEGLLLNAYDAIVRQTTSVLNILPFGQFKNCTSINTIVKLVNDNIDPYNLPLIGNVKNRIYENRRRSDYLGVIKLSNEKRKELKKTLTDTLLFINNNPNNSGV